MEGTRIHIQSLGGAGKGRFARLLRQLRATAFRLFSDESLMSRARAGDVSAFDALVARHRGRLHALALDSLRSEGVAGDAFCEAVLAAFENIDSCGAKCTAGTWLYLHGFRAVFKRMHVPPDGKPVNALPPTR